MAQAYSEDQLVEQPTIALLATLGWQTASALEEDFGNQGTLGRETKGNAVLLPCFRSALERLNPSLPPEALSQAIDQLIHDRSAMSLVAANREVYGLLKDGIPVSVQDRDGGQKTERVRVVDWENPTANDFLLVSQLSITGPLYTRRPDLVGFVNGLPLVVIELKKPSVPAQQAFDDNLTCYKADIPQLFWFNGLIIASNGTESRVGSLTADWERFFEWKRIEREDEPRRVSLEVMLRVTCEPSRLLDLLENFTLFSEHKAGLVKVLGQNHQFLGVNNAIVAMLTARKQGHGRGGVYLAKFEELIESYNVGSRNIDELFKELLALSRSLNREQERHVREHLSEEELVIFDILTRPAPELSREERAEIKKVAKDLLEKLKQLLVLNWRQTVTARSRVKLTIEDVLDQGLPRAYTPDLYKQKCSSVFEHVYEAYGDRGTSQYVQSHGV